MSKFNPVLSIIADFVQEHSLPNNLRINLGYGMKLVLTNTVESVDLPSNFFQTPEHVEKTPVDLDQIIESLFPAE
jgi:hypothetical protein